MNRNENRNEVRKPITKLIENYQIAQNPAPRAKVDMDIYLFFNGRKSDFLL